MLLRLPRKISRVLFHLQNITVVAFEADLSGIFAESLLAVTQSTPTSSVQPPVAQAQPAAQVAAPASDEEEEVASSESEADSEQEAIFPQEVHDGMESFACCLRYTRLLQITACFSRYKKINVTFK
jgi:hypothetical protein